MLIALSFHKRRWALLLRLLPIYDRPVSVRLRPTARGPKQ
jgi:hypothetical protein